MLIKYCKYLFKIYVILTNSTSNTHMRICAYTVLVDFVSIRVELTEDVELTEKKS